MRILQRNLKGLTSLCKKCDDIITCAGSGHHLHPERIESGTPYFGKSLSVRPLSLPEFLRWCLLSRHLWFIVCFGKLSLSHIPVRNNQVASDRASAVAKVPSKWRGHQKRTEFLPGWRVKCGMSPQPAGNIQLRVPHRPIDLQKCWRFPYMLLWWLHRRRWDQLCAAGTSHTKHQSSLNEGVLHVSRWDLHLPKYGSFEN